MKLPVVPRSLLVEITQQRDYFRARTEALTADLLAMRRDGFALAKPARVTEPVDEEAEALKAAERQLIQTTMQRRDDAAFIATAAKRIMADTGVSEAQAYTEARRLRRAVTDEDSPT